MRLRSTAEWQRLLDAADVPNMPANTPADLLHDPHLRATGFVRETEHPSEGRLHSLRSPTRWTGTPLDDEATPAPQLGQHTRDVLAEAGYPADAIEALLRNGACGAHAPIENPASGHDRNPP